jgi:hypothetical protein
MTDTKAPITGEAPSLVALLILPKSHKLHYVK